MVDKGEDERPEERSKPDWLTWAPRKLSEGRTFFREVNSELRKVTWPGRDEVQTTTVVVIGTTNDPATPYEWAVSLADQLESGVLITRVGEGHTGYNKGNACVDSAVERYLVEGVAPDGDLRCE